MINLSPDDYKESLRYARRSSKLLRWVGGTLIILMAVLLTQLIGFTYLKSETKRYQEINASITQDLKNNDLEGTLKTVENISGSLKLIVQVLSKQVLFSELIKQVGSVMPENTVLSNIEISKVEGGIDLSAETKDQESATQIQVNLMDPNNKLFDKVDIVSISCGESNPTYPCRATFRALFTKDNPFLFVNNKSAGSNQ
ncbi:MAG: hypothetical protein H6793_02490 [Candidatus Nomurabacteria bacterium]|nr:hypothetical protein [Candidatus Saccharibacteria bacterium]USN95184.1 MAG: hypothetical protein H6793_02490 [Candidatus Nomurabacteria bacterium]